MSHSASCKRLSQCLQRTLLQHTQLITSPTLIPERSKYGNAVSTQIVASYTRAPDSNFIRRHEFVAGTGSSSLSETEFY